MAAYTVSFGSTAKRVNSTLQTYTEVISASCYLKEPCDFYNPTFTYQGAFPENLNYMFVAAISRYYWITSINFVLGHWEIIGKIDAMATYKTDIGAEYFYITRASAAIPSRLPDPYAVVLSDPVISRKSDSIGLSATGCYVICCVGSSNNKFFMLSEAEWEGLYSQVYSSGFLQSYYNIWDQIVQDVGNAVLKPEDYIISAKWLPCPVQGTMQSIQLGFFNTAVQGGAIDPGTIVFTRWFNNWVIPSHPQAAAYGAYLNGNAYRKINLALPGYGNLVIDADVAAACPYLDIVAEMDITGCMTYSIDLRNGNGDSGYHTYVTTDLSTDAGFAVSRSGISNAVAAVATGALVGGGIGALIQGAGSVVTNLVPQVERASSGGSRSVLAGGGLVILTVVNYEIQTPAPAAFGYPLCLYGRPSDYPGFIKCQDASIACRGTQAEIEEINSYLNGGFFYE